MTSALTRQLLREVLQTPIAVQKNGKAHKISLLRAIILKQAQRAAAGDTRAAKFLLESADRYLAGPTRYGSARTRTGGVLASSRRQTGKPA